MLLHCVGSSFFSGRWCRVRDLHGTSSVLHTLYLLICLRLVWCRFLLSLLSTVSAVTFQSGQSTSSLLHDSDLRC
ncbi:hypothetical protein KC19_1G257800 [Ceratodon purpureus]|uniref:Uncharacterized protein n=1 Tax=Ceratodon purpureus TaxID=3225 RepID=A0A8T0JAG9_CERPU|nr:hypothetical protein KC19_1G257800 [Ceratodon purpureus]